MNYVLASELARAGIGDARVLAAMMRVAREAFVAPGFEPLAQADTALPIGHGQTISQPFVVAAMTSALQVGEGARVLEIGTGSGYQTAVLAELGCEVWTIERVPQLARRAALVFARLGLRVHLRQGDGSRGWPEEAPFDGILATAAARQVPQPLLRQLRVGARLVIPVGPVEAQRIEIVTRRSAGFTHERGMAVQFVPFVGA